MACNPGQHTVKSYCRKARSRLGKRSRKEEGSSNKRRKVSASAGTKRDRSDEEGSRKRRR